MYYFYRKSNRGHGICPLYRGCPPFGESIIRGFTVCLGDYCSEERLVLDVWPYQTMEFYLPCIWNFFFFTV